MVGLALTFCWSVARIQRSRVGLALTFSALEKQEFNHATARFPRVPARSRISAPAQCDFVSRRYPSAAHEEEARMFKQEVQVLFTAAMRCDGVCKVYGTAIKDGKVKP